MLQLPKSNAIRCSDWEAGALTAEQVRYAALDAYASLRVYRALQAIPTPPQPAGAAPCLARPVLAFGGAEGVDLADGVEAADAAEKRAAAAGLSRAKSVVYGLHRSGLSAAQIAEKRHIQTTTATSYLADAAVAGLPVKLQLAGVSDDSHAALLERLSRGPLEKSSWHGQGQGEAAAEKEYVCGGDLAELARIGRGSHDPDDDTSEAPDCLPHAPPLLSRAEAVAAATQSTRLKALIAELLPAHEVKYSEAKLVVALFEHSRLARRKVGTPPPLDDAPLDHWLNHKPVDVQHGDADRAVTVSECRSPRRRVGRA